MAPSPFPRWAAEARGLETSAAAAEHYAAAWAGGAATHRFGRAQCWANPLRVRYRLDRQTKVHDVAPILHSAAEAESNLDDKVVEKYHFHLDLQRVAAAVGWTRVEVVAAAKRHALHSE